MLRKKKNFIVTDERWLNVEKKKIGIYSKTFLVSDYWDCR